MSKVKIFNNFVDNADCQSIIEKIEHLYNEKKLKQTPDGRLSISDLEDDLLQNLVQKYHNKKIQQLDDSFVKYNSYIVTKYKTGIAMGIHTDSNEGEEMSVLMYLNDNYDGGEFTYIDENGLEHSIKPKTGDMIYCPSWYSHGVNKVTSGTRYFFTINLLKQ